MTLHDFRLLQATQALAWNAARSRLPPAQIAAAVRMEIALGRICERRAAINKWRRTERDIEDGRGFA